MTHTAAATGTPALGPPCTGEAIAVGNGAEVLQQSPCTLLTMPSIFDWFGRGVGGGHGGGARDEHVGHGEESNPSPSGDVRAHTAYRPLLAESTETCAQSYC